RRSSRSGSSRARSTGWSSRNRRSRPRSWPSWPGACAMRRARSAPDAGTDGVLMVEVPARRRRDRVRVVPRGLDGGGAPGPQGARPGPNRDRAPTVGLVADGHVRVPGVADHVRCSGRDPGRLLERRVVLDLDRTPGARGGRDVGGRAGVRRTGGGGPPGAAAPRRRDAALQEPLSSPVALWTAVFGVAVLPAITWLMIFKPFQVF